MSRPRMKIGPEVVERARQLRTDGASWRTIGETLGYHDNTLRQRLDPEFAAASRFKYVGPLSFIRAGEHRVSQADAARALAAIPRDTRTVQARLFGDPLPGRSALDRRQAQ